MQSFSLDLSLFTDASCLEISLTCFSPNDIIVLGITYMPYLKPKMTVSDTPLLPNSKRSPAKTPWLGTKEPLPFPILKVEVQGDITHPKLNMDILLPWYLIPAIFKCWDNSTGRVSMALWPHHWPRSQLCWDSPDPCNGTDQGWKAAVAGLSALCVPYPWPHSCMASPGSTHTIPSQNHPVSLCFGITWEIQLCARNK